MEMQVQHIRIETETGEFLHTVKFFTGLGNLRHKKSAADQLERPRLEYSGTPSRTRTWDPLIKNQKAGNCKSLEDKEDASNPESRVASCVPILRENKPELAEIVEAWEQLPDAIRNGILAMIRSAK